MDAPTSTSSENENPVPDYLNPEEELSSGNNRLALIVGAIVVLVVVGYLLLPAQVTRRISAAMPAPVMELGEATVMGARATEDTVSAAEDIAAKQLVAQPAAATLAKPTAASPTRATAAPASSNEEQEQEPALAVAPAVLPTALEPVEVAPTMVTMNGRVLDENGHPLAGATIMLRGTKTVASTDAAGNYSLEVPASGDNTLLYGYGGYEDQLLRTRNAKNQNVTLVPKETSRRRRK